MYDGVVYWSGEQVVLIEGKVGEGSEGRILWFGVREVWRCWGSILYISNMQRPTRVVLIRVTVFIKALTLIPNMAPGAWQGPDFNF